MRQKLPALILLLFLVSCTSSGAGKTALPSLSGPVSTGVVNTPVASAAAGTSTLPAAPEPITGTAAATAVPTLGSGEFQNPVIRSNFPDPFIIKVENTYYAYATNGGGKNVQTATSTDLVNWQLGVDAMPALASWVKISSPDIWAPEVAHVGDKYLLYYTGRDKASGKQCVGVATSDHPEKFFKDTRESPIVCQTKEGGTIDPDPFQDGDKLYLYYKNDGNCCGMPTHIYVQQLAADGLSVQGEPTALLVNDKPWEGKVIEAPTMFKHEDKYYLFFSANDYGGYQYAVGYATCESATGPCQDAAENPILSSRMNQAPLVVGPGHQALIQVGDQTWIVYHVWEILSSGLRSDRRMMWIDKLDWKNGLPVVMGPTTAPQPKP